MGGDFIRDIIDDDLRAGRHTRVATRFPPEPNGYLHIGHAKSICLNFGIASDYGGTCNLRYDDTNPAKEDVEYVEAIERDVRWLGFEPTAVLFSADYFPAMYEMAEKLVGDGKAYVCDLDDEQIKDYRGSLTESGRPSPFRDRPIAENLGLLRRMKAGEFADGARTLRAKIDMASPNMKMRDPLLYRIRHASHHRTGDAWCIYPMYDYAHPLEDAIEGITHSICTLEFENNRELYDWVIEHAWGRVPAPRQYEFARLNLDYTVMSKRKLLQLVTGGHVAGWDDPRMPTIAGMRRRGYSPGAIRAFCDMVGVAKTNSVVDLGKLEFCVRDDLNRNAPRVMAVLRPLEVELVGWDGGDETIDAPSFPPDVGKPGSRPIAIGPRIVIERDDWRDDPPPGYQRLAPGRTVRLRHAYCITCDDVERDAAGAPIRLRCRVHRETLGGKHPADGSKVAGVIHWVSATRSLAAEIRLYDRLFAHPRPDEGGGDFLARLDPASLDVVTGARVEDSLGSAAIGSRWQFERTGYFIVDHDSRGGALVFNRIVSLRDKEKVKVDEPVPVVDKKDNVKAATRPKTRSPHEYRAEARARDPDLAAAYRRATDDFGLPSEHADLVSGDTATARLFVGAANARNAAAIARWIINELPRALDGGSLDETPVAAPHFAALVDLVESGAISTPAAKDVLAEMVKTGGDPEAIVATRGLGAIADETELARLVDDVMVRNPDKVAQYRGGKTGLHGFFVGQVVKASGGKANPTLVSKLVSDKLAT